MLFLLCVAFCFLLRGFHVEYCLDWFSCVFFFSSPLSIAITSLGEARADLCTSCAFFGTR